MLQTCNNSSSYSNKIGQREEEEEFWKKEIGFTSLSHTQKMFTVHDGEIRRRRRREEEEEEKEKNSIWVSLAIFLASSFLRFPLSLTSLVTGNQAEWISTAPTTTTTTTTTMTELSRQGFCRENKKSLMLDTKKLILSLSLHVYRYKSFPRSKYKSAEMSKTADCTYYKQYV